MKLPKKRKKEREISVHAPDYIPKRETIIQDTTGTEALDVFKVSGIIGRVLSFVLFAVGIFVVVISAYSILTSIKIFLNPLFIGFLGLIGCINILCGLLLLSKK
jgi:uncharacterized Tic20 family protein